MSDCGVCLYSESDGSIEFCHVKNVAARKDYKCYECDRPITKGTVHQYASGKQDGEFWDARTCLVCAEIRSAFYCDGPEMFGAFWDQMDMDEIWGRMTTGCLNRLKTPEAKAYLIQRWNDWKFSHVNR